jgi:hypothetical protein
LKSLHLSKGSFLYNKEAGYFPYFQFILRNRINKKKAVNVAVTGEAGEGKSYLAWTLCRLLHPDFSVKQIVYRYRTYMNALRSLPLGFPIMFDEPSYALSKRDWYKEVNKVLVQTLESQRFKVKPVVIPVINQNLLDKTVRTYLLQFQVVVMDRGVANVYRLQASQYQNKLYRHWICELRYPLLGACPEKYKEYSSGSCLGCRYLNECPTFRAQYERKKASIQDVRYKQAERDAEYIESKDLTDRQIENKVYEVSEEYTDKEGNIDVDLMRIVAQEQLQIHIGHSKAYKIKKALVYHHPEQFQ